MYTERQLQTNARKSTEVKKKRKEVYTYARICDGERRQKSRRTENDCTHNRDLPSI